MAGNGISTNGGTISQVALRIHETGGPVVFGSGAYDPQVLLDGTYTTGPGPAVTLSGAGGPYTIVFRGTFNGASVTIQNVTQDNVTWENTLDNTGTQLAAVTAPSSVSLNCFKGTILRLVISGGPPTSLRAQVGGLG